MAKTYGIGIMGGRQHLLGLYPQPSSSRELHSLGGVADITPSREEARRGIRRCGDDADELLKHSEIDVIVNLTIPVTHYQVSTD